MKSSSFWTTLRRLPFHAVVLSMIACLAVLHLTEWSGLVAKPPLSIAAQSPLAQQYRAIYADQMSRPAAERRYLIFELEDKQLGWGNRVEATGGAFHVAVQTGRIFVIHNHALWDVAFDGDPLAPTAWDVHSDDIAVAASVSQLTVKDVQFYATPSALWDSELLRNVSVAVLDTTTTRPIVYATEIWGDEHGFYSGMGAIVSYLTSQPSPALRAGIADARARFNLTASATLAVVQMRTMYDDPDNYARAMQAPKQAAFWVCAARALTGLDPSRAEILFTTDAHELNGLARDVLGAYGRVLVDDGGPVVHTADVRDGEFAAPIADWWLMGQADRLVCTGTSFCHTAVWRSRSRAAPHFWILFNLYRASNTICRRIDA